MCSLRIDNPTYAAVLLVAVVYDFSVNLVGVPSACDVSFERDMCCDVDGSIQMDGVP